MPRLSRRATLLAAAASLLLAAPPASASRETECDPFASRACLMPFPNDMNLTVRDSSTPTGRRVRLPRTALPPNKDGVRADPAEWNRGDGFSPGQLVAVRVPGLTSARAVRRSGLTPVTDLARYRRRSASLVVIDAVTRRRQMVWAEVDVNNAPARQRLLLIHPAKNFVKGRRYIVVLRNLRTASGRRIRAQRSFRRVMAGRGPAKHRGRYRGIFRTLKRAGIGKRGLYLTWDFTVASQEAIQGRLLSMRREAFAQLGDTALANGVVEGSAPGYSIMDVRDTPDDPLVARSVSGTFDVPCYLEQAGCPVGSRLNFASGGRDALPAQQPGNVQRARFDCIIPRAAFQAPGRIQLHGHGLLGSGSTQLLRENVREMAAEHNFVTCATNWYGFSDEDIPQAIKALGNGNEFPAFVDRQLQGHLAQMFLGRLMLHPQGLAASGAFMFEGRPTMDVRELFYDGNSQGGIMGATLAAVSPDYRRAVLGVPGINFSTLLYRSSNWDVYGKIFNPAFPDAGNRILALGLIQMLWDRSEPSGWAANVTSDPPPDTPAKNVLLHVAVGDWQVSTWQADALARTIGGVYARRPAHAAGRTLERSELYGIPAIPQFPFGGSGIVYWDAGADFTGVTPAADVPPRGGRDPHFVPRQTPEARRQKSEFLRPNGAIVEVCTPGAPCEGVDAPDG
jgi:hypothetical protein